MDKKNMDIGDIIKEKRDEKHLTYEQLGNLIGVGKSTVRKWEKGMINDVKRSNLAALCNILHIDPALLLGFAPTPKIYHYQNAETNPKKQEVIEEILRTDMTNEQIDLLLNLIESWQ